MGPDLLSCPRIIPPVLIESRTWSGDALGQEALQLLDHVDRKAGGRGAEAETRLFTCQL
jgi:hypothetical protein